METTIDGLKLNYETAGDGTPVLLLHGWGGCAQSFLPVLDYLKKEFKVVAPDLPGFGASSEPPQPWSVSEYTSLVTKFIADTGIGPCHIIAHSFGGRIAILLAAQNPELVKKIILCDSAGILPKRGLRYYFRVYKYKIAKKAIKCRFAKSLLRIIGFNVEKAVRNAGSSDYRKLNDNMKKTFVRVVNQDLRPCLPRIGSSVLLVWGEKDTDTPVYMARIMEKEIPDAGLVLYADAGHFSYLDRIGDFNRVASYFLKGK